MALVACIELTIPYISWQFFLKKELCLPSISLINQVERVDGFAPFARVMNFFQKEEIDQHNVRGGQDTFSFSYPYTKKTARIFCLSKHTHISTWMWKKNREKCSVLVFVLFYYLPLSLQIFLSTTANKPNMKAINSIWMNNDKSRVTSSIAGNLIWRTFQRLED